MKYLYIIGGAIAVPLAFAAFLGLVALIVWVVHELGGRTALACVTIALIMVLGGLIGYGRWSDSEWLKKMYGGKQ